MVHLRLAEVADALGIARAHVESWRRAYAGIMPDELLANLDPVERANDWTHELRDGAGTAVVAVRSENIVGFSYFSKSRDDDAGDTDGEVQAIYVDPPLWRTGVGRMLLEETLSRLHALGFEQVSLWVLAENLPARDFYEAMGFRPDGTTKRDPETGLVEIRFTKSLTKKA